MNWRAEIDQACEDLKEARKQGLRWPHDHHLGWDKVQEVRERLLQVVALLEDDHR